MLSNGQTNCISELGQAGHKLSTPGVIFRPVVEVEEPALDEGKTGANLGPEILQTIDDTIGGDLGGCKVAMQFIQAR